MNHLNVKPVVHTLIFLFALALPCAHGADTVKNIKKSASAKPGNVSSKQPKTEKTAVITAEKTIKTHIPAKGSFQHRRTRIFEAIKREYEDKKDVQAVLKQYLEMDEFVNRGTNWIIDDNGDYHRMRPLSVQCKELEDSLNLSPEF